MKELRLLETSALIDMLADYTTEYLKLAGGMGKESEYAKCALTVKALQSEIEARRRSAAKTLTQNHSRLSHS